MNIKSKALIALLISSVIWGIAPPVIKITLNYITPARFLFYRFLLAFLLIAVPLFIKLKKSKPTKKQILFYLLLGFLCTPLNLYLLFLGLNRTSAIDASLISIISPILVVTGSVLFLKETVRLSEIVGICLAIAGMVLTIIEPLFDLQMNIYKNIQGNLLVFAGSIVWVIFTILTKKKQNQIDPFILVSLSFLIGLVFIFPFACWESHLQSVGLFSFNFKAIFGILFMAIFSSVAAYWCYAYGLSKIPASRATIFTYLQPVFAIPIAIIFLQETVSTYLIIGALFIITGVFICERPKNFKAGLNP